MLYQAVRSNKLLMIEFLLEYGVHKESKQGLLAKRFAVYQENTLALLLKYIKDSDEINQGLAGRLSSKQKHPQRQHKDIS